MKLFLLFFPLAAPLLFSNASWAWGSRGHSTICETAVFLVKEKNLKTYLETKTPMMGHLCNIPDIYWRSLGAEPNKLGNPTHYIEAEALGVAFKDISLDYAKNMEDFVGKPNHLHEGKIFSVHPDLGSLWWRADQFYRRAIGLKADLENAKPPENRIEELNDKLPFNDLTFQFIVNLGLMGHFVGDNSQPLHTTADHDGYGTGHGGIHSFYEDTLVGKFDGDLAAKVLKKARELKNQSYLKPSTVLEKMRALTEVSNKEIAVLLKYDVVTKKSEVRNEKGMEIKTPAERKNADEIFKKLSPYIIEQMARSSLLLAQLWDQAYIEVNRPLIEKNKIYKYPLTPDFVAPDYLLVEKKSSNDKNKTEK